jgi:signal transduction histidine kinase
MDLRPNRDGKTGEAPLRILHLEDTEPDRELVKALLGEAGILCELTAVESRAEFSQCLTDQTWDAILSDFLLPAFDGLSALEIAVKLCPMTPFIFVTGAMGDEAAVNSLKSGATDYVVKTRMERLAPALRRALNEKALQRKISQQRSELENFARVLAHDLRAPAASIQTFAYRVQERLQEGCPEEAEKYASWLVDTAARMSLLIETLHRYTTADAPVEFGSVDMNQLLEAAQANLQDLIQKSDARVTADQLPTVFGNAPQLVQLLQNLIGNSIKYCDKPEPRIHLASSEKDGRAWLISLTDNGIGIPEAELQRIFEPFIRVSSATRRKGTGLGLATCKKIVERHRGSIWCESRLAAGSTFFFTLPKVDV